MSVSRRAMNILVVFFLSLMEWGVAVRRSDYCKISQQHTLCKYNCETSKACQIVEGEEGYVPLTGEQQDNIVDIHNRFRDAIASGLQITGFREAENMMVLSYDKELEYMAACWLRQCIWGLNKAHKDMHGVECGQNRATQFSKDPINTNKYWILDILTSWYKEFFWMGSSKEDIVDGNISPTNYTNFTQMIWAETLYVGCAKMTTSQEKGMHRYDFYCNYKPKGNVPGQPVYFAKPKQTNGTTNNSDPTCSTVTDHENKTSCIPVSSAKPATVPHYKGKCIKNLTDYKSLCGKIRPRKEDSFVPPTGHEYDLSSAMRNTLAKVLLLPLSAIIVTI